MSLSQRPCVAESEATSPSSAGPRALRSLTCPSAHPFPLLNFLRLPPTSPPLLTMAQIKLPIPCQSIFLPVPFFTSPIFPGLHIPFLPSRRHLLLFPSIRWKSLLTLLHPSGLFFSLCVSKLFERIIQSCLLFFLESNSILCPCQAGFRHGRSTLDQILFLSQSISDGLTNPKPGSRTILSTIDFSKAFDFFWNFTIFHKFISAGLPPCFARWTPYFLSDRRACVVYQNHSSRSF